VLYSARHTFLTRLGASGCDVWTLMRIAGHSSITISSRYVHPHADTIDRAFAALAGQPAKTIANAGRHKTRHSGKTGKPRVEGKIARNVREYKGFLVSAAGLEPATHALKGSPNLVQTTTCTSSLLHTPHNKISEMQIRRSSGCPEGVRDFPSEPISY
jgi:hypothetical protein